MVRLYRSFPLPLPPVWLSNDIISNEKKNIVTSNNDIINRLFVCKFTGVTRLNGLLHCHFYNENCNTSFTALKWSENSCAGGNGPW